MSTILQNPTPSRRHSIGAPARAGENHGDDSVRIDPLETQVNAINQAAVEIVKLRFPAHDFASRYSLLLLDPKGCVQSWNKNMQRLLGYEDSEIIGEHVAVFYVEADRLQGAPEGELCAAATAGYYCGEGIRRRRDGSTFEARVQITALHDSSKRMFGFIELIQDIGCPAQEEPTSTRELLHAAERLHQENESMRTMLAVMGEGIITTDAHGIVTSVNPTAEQLTGWPSHEAVGKPVSSVFQLLNESTRLPVNNPVARALCEERIIELEGSNLLLSRDGTRVSVEDSCAPVFNQDLQVTGAVLVFRDVTSQRRHTRELQHQAQHDSLTGLVNRAEFERRLQRILESSNSPHVLFYLDLDRFKVVNDACGHLAGDELLRQAAALIESKVRNRDTVARLGGDEFAILLEHCELPQALRIAETIHNALCRHPFVWDHKSFRIGVSIGVATLAGGDGTVVQLIEAVDSACYQAKQFDGPHIHVHGGQGNRRSTIPLSVNWERRLRHALANDLFQLHFQPIARIADNDAPSLRGEVLLRLADTGDGIVSPNAFLASAERGRLMPEIDRWVLQHLLALLKPYASSLVPERDLVSVNVSAQSIASKEFLAFMEDQLTGSGLAPECLCFEISEDAASCNLRASLNFMATLHNRRHRLALDNFGTGLSSFDHLRSLPIQFIKMNGNLIRDVASDPVDTAIVEAVHRVGKLLGVQTVGVAAETDLILNQLRSVGLDYVQGFSVARPEPLPDALAQRIAA